MFSVPEIEEDTFASCLSEKGISQPMHLYLRFARI
jgi:transposase